MRLQNIRSIGEESQTIDFIKPLTIIQGPNGTGKTTAVEALNFVTSGTLPPGKLPGFVHSQRLSKKKKVDALVQLEFVNFHGVWPKTNKITTKSEEFTLAVRKPNGEVGMVSSKVADFNREMLNHFGVTAAVLNYVIFCHQEESTWPLSEPKELKLRFDAIFEVSKYVKAMEGLKDTIKELQAELLVVTTEIPYLDQANKDRAQLVLSREETNNQLTRFRKDIKDDSKELREVEDELKKNRKDTEEVTKMENQAALISNEIKNVQESLQGLKVDPFPGTKEELQCRIDQSLRSSQMTDITAKREKTKETELRLYADLALFNSEAEQIQAALNTAEANEMMLNNYKTECDDLVKQGQEKYGIQGDGAHFIAFFTSTLKSLESDLKNLDNLRSGDRQQDGLDLNEARRLSHENQIMHTVKSREEDNLIISVQKTEKSLKEVTEKLDQLYSNKNHLKVRLNKMIQRERVDLALVSNQLSGLQNEANVLTDLSSHEINIDDLIDGVEGLSVDHEQAFEKLSVRFLANRLRKNVNLSEKRDGVEELKRVQTEVVDLKKELNELEGTEVIYRKWAASLDETGDCPLCEKKCNEKDGHKMKDKLSVVNLNEEIMKIKSKLAEAQKKEMNLIFHQRVRYVNDEIKMVREKIEKESEVSRMEADLNRQIENVEKIIFQTEGSKSKFEADLAEKKSALASVQVELEQIRGRREQLKANLEKCKKKVEDTEVRNRTERNELSSQITERKSFLDSLTRIHQKLANQRNLSVNKEESERRKIELNEKIEATRREINNCTITLANCDNEESQHRILELQMRIMNGQEKIVGLKAQLASLGIKQKPSLQELNEKATSLNKRALILRNQISQKEGGLSELQKKLKEIDIKLKQDSMVNAKVKLHERVIEKMVLQAGIEDINKFRNVLDESIIAFHHGKMEEINAILFDLWPKVYQGTDVETIRIKSQPASGTDKRKSYDYSVVMVVEQEEIEMRGRCSAGQKMLASILIRIALADVFGMNCPILTLDEPTTNLDSSKIENMGSMLKDLLDVFNSGDNFTCRSDLQLIVITHDDRLVQYLVQTCRPDFIQVLSKDELGMTHISKKTSLDS
ncbi:unnamed protein product [Bursaphelenchus xylophilus]|uniref:(pine wood nematode) hypothetical protein n=1 Tax=Bursaphelenchus xylophilus TaxID=6326 RepID=A0A7I8X611_BURXY|nr:unnamed protein product [Bursaphelenchus xylophilus]CAG9123006.1 unnamed protein product [Bursaphelenchus xylophilus]